MFRGISTASIDDKGRLLVPVRHRERFSAWESSDLILTVNPWDRCLWLYPMREWESIEAKLQALGDYDKQVRRTKQIMRGYATECALDGQGRILIPAEMREFAAMKTQVVVMGQGNKCEIWDKTLWGLQTDEWLHGIDQGGAPSRSALLDSLSL
jgi:MraZ protein